MRPSTKDVHVRMQHELAREIDEVRRRESDLPSKPEMVRRLVTQALAARAADDSRAA